MLPMLNSVAWLVFASFMSPDALRAKSFSSIDPEFEVEVKILPNFPNRR
jgi:hypothetical protein